NVSNRVRPLRRRGCRALLCALSRRNGLGRVEVANGTDLLHGVGCRAGVCDLPLDADQGPRSHAVLPRFPAQPLAWTGRLRRHRARLRRAPEVLAPRALKMEI